MLEELITTKAKATAVMMEFPAARDDDKKLWLIIMRRYYGLDETLRGSKQPLTDFCDWFLSKDLPSFESIRRVRQKIQEQVPELRGNLYEKRHKEAEAVKEWAR